MPASSRLTGGSCGLRALRMIRRRRRRGWGGVGWWCAGKVGRRERHCGTRSAQSSSSGGARGHKGRRKRERGRERSRGGTFVRGSAHILWPLPLPLPLDSHLALAAPRTSWRTACSGAKQAWRVSARSTAGRVAGTQLGSLLLGAEANAATRPWGHRRLQPPPSGCARCAAEEWLALTAGANAPTWPCRLVMGDAKLFAACFAASAMARWRQVCGGAAALLPPHPPAPRWPRTTRKLPCNLTEPRAGQDARSTAADHPYHRPPGPSRR